MSQRLPTNAETSGIWLLLWLGTFWGAGEALIGGLLHLILPPTYAGRLMLLLAGALCAFGVRVTGRASAPMAMAALAAPLKLCSAAIFGIPLLMPMVMNPFFSILAQGAAFALIAGRLLARPEASPARFAAAGALAGGLQVGFFVAAAGAAGRWLYLSPQSIAELGFVYPGWMLSPAGWVRLCGHLLPVAVCGGAIAAFAARRAPRGDMRRWQPLYLGAGAALCALIALLSYWRV
jgi:hypothetical protein